MLDITPTLLTLFGLPVGEDMDGKVLVRRLRAARRRSQTIPSWEDVAGNDGRHPPHTRLDPVASREALEQLVALGYIARPDENSEKAVAETVRELRYNLGEAYQDADRHAEALEIFRELHQLDPDEQRYAVHRFVSCQALGLRRRDAIDRRGPGRPAPRALHAVPGQAQGIRRPGPATAGRAQGQSESAKPRPRRQTGRRAARVGRTCRRRP